MWKNGFESSQIKSRVQSANKKCLRHFFKDHSSRKIQLMASQFYNKDLVEVPCSFTNVICETGGKTAENANIIGLVFFDVILKTSVKDS